MFGKKINFTVNNQKHFTSFEGALISILVFIIAIIFGFIFGRDFFFQINPKVSIYNEIFSSGLKGSLNPNNFNFAFQIINTNNITVEPMPDLFFTFNLYYKDFKNPNNSILIDLPISKCSKDNSPILYNMTNLKYKDYYCLDLTNSSNEYILGGSRSSDFYSYINMFINRCSNINDESTCTDKEKLKKLFYDYSKSWSIEFVWLQSFYTGSSEQPIIQTYVVKRNPIDLLFQRSDGFYFEQLYIKDDKGWILPNIETTYTYSLSNKETNFFYENFDDLGPILYNIILFLKNQRPIIDRSYMKIQDLFALLGGFFKGLMIVFSFFANYINLYKQKLFLMNRLFEINYDDKQITRYFYNNKDYKII